MQRFGETTLHRFPTSIYEASTAPVYRERRSKTNYTIRGLFKSSQDYKPTQYLLRSLFRSLEKMSREHSLASKMSGALVSSKQQTTKTAYQDATLSPATDLTRTIPIKAHEMLQTAQAAVPWPPLAPNLQYSSKSASKKALKNSFKTPPQTTVSLEGCLQSRRSASG